MGVIDDVVAIVSVTRARRRGSGARYGAHSPSDRRADTSTTAASRDRAYDGPGARANQPSAQSPFGGIVGIR
jgi:hypothetical protein